MLVVSSKFCTCLCNKIGRTDIIVDVLDLQLCCHIVSFPNPFHGWLSRQLENLTSCHMTGPIMGSGRCFDFRWWVHASVFGLTCIPIPLSYAAHLLPICPLVSCSLQACLPHLKSFAYVNPAPHPVSPSLLNLQVPIEMIRRQQVAKQIWLIGDTGGGEFKSGDRRLAAENSELPVCFPACL